MALAENVSKKDDVSPLWYSWIFEDLPSRYQEAPGGPIARAAGEFRNIDYTVKKDIEKEYGNPTVYGNG